jgi:pimeloyl-ACP methyl ester carboxylesterase
MVARHARARQILSITTVDAMVSTMRAGLALACLLPTLVVGGKRDQMTPLKAGQALAAAIAGFADRAQAQEQRPAV